MRSVAAAFKIALVFTWYDQINEKLQAGKKTEKQAEAHVWLTARR